MKKTYRLTTPYSERLDRNAVWNEYPRPQFKRNSYMNLNGEWDFAVSKENTAPSEYREKILVPFPPESALSGIGRRINKGEKMYYRRGFTLPSDFVRDRVILHFGAVDQIATLYINGKELCRNEGGYLPFSCDITEALIQGENELLLVAEDELSKVYPYGKQTDKRGGMWYTPVSGIWQTVWLESLPENPIRKIKITADMAGATVEVDTDAAEKTLTLKSGESYTFTENKIRIEPSDIHLWTPDSPYLYEFTLSTATDEIESYFALREIGIGDFCGIKRVTLNKKPYLFSGLLDQGYYPDGIFLPATVDGYIDDIMLAKRLGFNMQRKHIKIEPLIFYHLCDKLGMVIFQDLVNSSEYSFLFDTAFPTVGITKQFMRHNDQRTRKVFIEQLHGTLALLYNSPSVLQYTVFNEGWGQFMPDECYKLAKDECGGRLIDATSGWFAAKESDFDSRHIYFKPLKIKKPNGRPLFISEFGGYSLRIDSHLFGDSNYGYKRFATSDALADAISSLYINEALPLIGQGLSALVFTQLSDVEDETNGFITYDRRVVKIDEALMKSVNERLYRELDKATEK